jgi:hypothetical protein
VLDDGGRKRDATVRQVIEQDVIDYINATLIDRNVSPAEAIDLLLNLRDVFEPSDRKQLFSQLSNHSRSRLKELTELEKHPIKPPVGAIVNNQAIVDVGMMFATLASGDKIELSEICSYALPISGIIVTIEQR